MEIRQTNNSEAIVEAVSQWSQGRIRTKTLRKFRKEPCLVWEAIHPTHGTIGVSGVIADGTGALVVVNPAFRGRGIGTELVKAQVESGIHFIAVIASSNHPSLRASQKAGARILVIDDRMRGIREGIE